MHPCDCGGTLFQAPEVNILNRPNVTRLFPPMCGKRNWSLGIGLHTCMQAAPICDTTHVKVAGKIHASTIIISGLHPPLYHWATAGFSSRVEQMTRAAASVAYRRAT